MGWYSIIYPTTLHQKFFIYCFWHNCNADKDNKELYKKTKKIGARLKNVSNLRRVYGLHPTQLRRWSFRFIKNLDPPNVIRMFWRNDTKETFAMMSFLQIKYWVYFEDTSLVSFLQINYLVYFKKTLYVRKHSHCERLSLQYKFLKHTL